MINFIFRKKLMSISMIIFLIICILIGIYTLIFTDKRTTPKLNHGKKWKIAYYEGGNYRTYRSTLIGFLQGLAEKKWIYPFDINDIPQDIDDKGDSKSLWLWACANIKSNYIKFDPQYFWSSNWITTIENDNVKLISDYGNSKIFDILLVMGTKAGKSLINNKNKFPILLLSVTNPVEAGIFKHDDSTGYDNVFTVYDPDRVERCLKIFYELIKFKKLGVIFSSSSPSVTGKQSLIEEAKNLNFTLNSCSYDSTTPDLNTAANLHKDCINNLIDDKIDSFYFTTILGLSTSTLPDFLKLLNDKKIPTASFDSSLVEHGVLLSYGMIENYNETIGKLAAEATTKILNGEKPGNIKNPYDKIPMGLIINTKTAKLLNIKIPEGVLQSAVKIY